MHSVKKLIWALIMQLLSTVYLIIVIIHGMIGSLQNRLVKFKTNIKMYQIFKPLKGAAFQKNQNKWRKKQQKHSPATHLFCFGCTCGYQYLLLTLVPPTQFPTLSQTDKSTGIHLDCMHLHFTLTWVRNHIHISEYFPLTWIGIQISWKIYVHKLTGSLTHNEALDMWKYKHTHASRQCFCHWKGQTEWVCGDCHSDLGKHQCHCSPCPSSCNKPCCWFSAHCVLF